MNFLRKLICLLLVFNLSTSNLGVSQIAGGGRGGGGGSEQVAMADDAPPSSPIPEPQAGHGPYSSVRNSFYVSPTGSSGGAGSIADPLDLTTACNSVGPGDIIYFLPGTYTQAIAPDSSGSASAPILFYGDYNDPGSVIVTSEFKTCRSRLILKGLTLGGITFIRGTYNGTTAGLAADSAKTATYNVIENCRMPYVHFYGGQNCRVSHSIITASNDANSIDFEGGEGGVVETGVLGSDGTHNRPTRWYHASCQYDTLSDNIIHQGTIYSCKAFEMAVFTNHCEVIRCKFDALIGAKGELTQQRAIYNSRNNTFTDCKWVSERAPGFSGNESGDVFWMRDSSQSNTFLRDTIYAGLNSSGAPTLKADLTRAGDSGWVGLNNSNRWSYCVYSTSGTNRIQDAGNAATNFITNCKITSDGSALSFTACSDADGNHVCDCSNGNKDKLKKWYIRDNVFTTGSDFAINVDKSAYCTADADTSFRMDYDTYHISGGYCAHAFAGYPVGTPRGYFPYPATIEANATCGP